MAVCWWSTKTSMCTWPLLAILWPSPTAMWRLPAHACGVFSSQPSVSPLRFPFSDYRVLASSLLCCLSVVYDLLPSWPPFLPPEADMDEIRCWLLLLLTSLEPQWEPHMCVCWCWELVVIGRAKTSRPACLGSSPHLSFSANNQIT